MRYRQLIAGEEADFRLELIGVVRIGGKHQNRSIRISAKFKHCKCGAGTDKTAPFDRLAGLWTLNLRRE